MRLSGCGGRLSVVAGATANRRCSGDAPCHAWSAAGTKRLRRAASGSIGRSTCGNAAGGRCVGLLAVVHTSFGRLMGREHVNCAAGPHQVLVYVKVIRRSLQVSGFRPFSALRNSAIPFSNDA